MCTQESWKSNLKYQCIAEKCNSRATSVAELLMLVVVGVLLKSWSTTLQNLPETALRVENGMWRKMEELALSRPGRGAAAKACVQTV